MQGLKNVGYMDLDTTQVLSVLGRRMEIRIIQLWTTGNVVILIFVKEADWLGRMKIRKNNRLLTLCVTICLHTLKN